MKQTLPKSVTEKLDEIIISLSMDVVEQAHVGGIIEPKTERLKQFLSDQLATQAGELREKVEGMEPKYETKLANTMPWNYSRTKYFTAGYNQALDDFLTLLGPERREK